MLSCLQNLPSGDSETSANLWIAELIEHVSEILGRIH